MPSLKVRPGAEPFFFISKAEHPVGCLCLHGLTASPFEVLWLGEYLAERGMMVCGPRLAGHGVDPALMHRVRWQDWYLTALDGYHLLRRYCDQVFVAGLSMGGLTALYLASQEAVAGVIAMAPAYRINGKNLWRAHLLRYTPITVGKSAQEADPLHQYVLQQQAARHQPQTGRVSYYEFAPTGVSELIRYQKAADDVIANITAPVLLMFADRDDTVPLSTLDLLKTKLTHARSVDAVRFPQSGHVITNDVEHQRAFESAWAFIQQHS